MNENWKLKHANCLWCWNIPGNKLQLILVWHLIDWEGRRSLFLNKSHEKPIIIIENLWHYTENLFHSWVNHYLIWIIFRENTSSKGDWRAISKMYVSVFDCNCTLFVFTKPALTEHHIKAEAENLSYVLLVKTII